MHLRYNTKVPAKSGTGISTPKQQAHSAPFAKRRIFCVRSSMAGCVGQSKDWPVPVAGSANPSQSAAFCLAPVAAVPVFNRSLVMSERTCKKCGLTKHVSDFYPHQCYECKECSKKRIRENRAANLEYYKEFDKARANLPHRVEARNNYQKTEQGQIASSRAKRRYVQKNPAKRMAHTMVWSAVRNGTLTQKPCESCGASPAHAHHDDYSRPLDVRWLCPPCHAAHHKAERQARKAISL